MKPKDTKKFQSLKIKLDKDIYFYLKRIKKDIKGFQKSNLNYRNLQYSPSFCVILKKGIISNFKAIGFPFPLITFPLGEIRLPRGVSVQIFLRGEVLRRVQRSQLLDELKKERKVIFEEINSLERFKEITKELCKKNKEINYFDPYSFIGDSYIGMHFLFNFLKKYKLKLNKIYSENYINLKHIGKTEGYTMTSKNNKKGLNIFVDLIDNHWDRTKHLVKKFLKKNLPCIICGRDLILIPKNKIFYVYHFNRDEILLKNKNIEDYMNDCLLPFLEPSEIIIKPLKITSKNIIINPFGSNEIKSIPLKLVYEIIKFLNKKHPESKILIVSGFKNSYSHIIWISKLKGMIFEGDLKNVIFKNYGAFEEIIKDLKKYKISCGLTADTSIAHLFNYLGITNLTFFNFLRCDRHSPQSLSSDSPLGFCRYGSIQYPILFPNHIEKIVKGTLGFLSYFLDKEKEISWAKQVFDEDFLLSKLSSKEKYLIESNKKINPLYKLKQKW